MSFVSKEIDGFILRLQVLQAVGFVPSIREDVDADLTSNRKGEAIRGKLFLESFNKCTSDSMFLIILVELDPLLLRTVSSDGRDIKHTLNIKQSKSSPYFAEFNKVSSLHRNLEVGNVN